MKVTDVIGSRTPIFYDLETYKQYALFTFLIDDEYLEYEFVGNDALDAKATIGLEDLYHRILKDYLLIGYNNKHYDNIILLTLFASRRTSPISPAEVNELSHRIIETKTLKWAQIPDGFLSYDVYNFQNHMPSLKIVGTLFGGDIRETPIPFSYLGKLSDSEIEDVKRYCRNDVRITKMAFESPLGQKYYKVELMMCNIAIQEIGPSGANLLWRMFSTSANYYEMIVKSKTNWRYRAPRTSPEDDHKPKQPKILTELKTLLKKYLSDTDLATYDTLLHHFYSEENFKRRAISDGKDAAGITLPIRDEVETSYGYGGAHGSYNTHLYIESKYGYKILHADFSSMYPNIMIKYKFYPPELPADVCDIYAKFADARERYKASGDRETADAYKPTLNSIPGKLRYRYSDLYHPATNFGICAMGQCLVTLLAMITKGRLVQLNTDGIMVLCTDAEYDLNVERIEYFSKVIKLKISIDEFSWFAQQSISSYGYGIGDSAYGIGGFFGGKSEWDPHLVAIQPILQKCITTGTPISQLVMDELEEFNVRRLVYISKTTAKFHAFLMTDCETGVEEQVSNRFMISVAAKVKESIKCGLHPKRIVKLGETKVQKISSFPPVVLNINTLNDHIPIECVDVEFYTNLIYSKMLGIAGQLGLRKF